MRARARLACRAEYDGYVECVLTASTSQPECGPLRFDDIGVTLPLRAGEVPYAAGAWLRSGLRPQKEYVWKWSPSFPRGGGHAPGMGESGGVWDNFAWLGSVEAGVQLRLKPASDSENMLAWKLMRPYPAGWHNDGRGGLRIAAPSDRGVVRLTAFTGARTVSVPLELRFSFMLTPVKPLSPAALFRARDAALARASVGPANSGQATRGASRDLGVARGLHSLLVLTAALPLLLLRTARAR